MSQEIKVGSVVCLNSSSQKFTVVEVIGSEIRIVCVTSSGFVGELKVPIAAVELSPKKGIKVASTGW